ncbi:hypothetical protein EW146_g842 [Bondarzewia mesenterica]|uniref:HTH CENPB-type domain-containing protein n=1 Tax=Bondarzewia mesenterica TaxID=1095465 RepID=A0A4S4M5T0_9AGAM|nr:hypothetical protein EW146_g842 [Bondarzewia mesenterica]
MDNAQHYDALAYQQHFSAHRQHLDSAMHTSPWQHHQHSPPTSSAAADHSRMYPVINNPINHLEYASPSTSSFVHQQPNAFIDPNHSAAVHPTHPLNMTGPQIESSIGPNRILTRRQRAAQTHPHPARREASTDPVLPGETHDRQQMYLMNHPSSRPQTPDSIGAPTQYPQYPDPHSMVMRPGPITVPTMPAASPQYATPPTSATPYSYGFYPSHSRSASNSANSASANSASNPRSASPALSVASVLTTVSSTSGPNSQSFPTFPAGSSGDMSPVSNRPPPPKQRKQRLYNIDRKMICIFHQQNPTMRQEDIALKYGVERSTISKIIKQKNKWLSVVENEEHRVAKHRPSKFPEIESELVKWLVECRDRKVVLSDAVIRSKAKEVAKALQIPDDKFKASSGWVENFKHRHGIRRGAWVGDGRDEKVAQVADAGLVRDEDDEDDRPRGPLADLIVKQNLYDINATLLPRDDRHLAHLIGRHEMGCAGAIVRAQPLALADPVADGQPIPLPSSLDHGALIADTSISSTSTHPSDQLPSSQHMDPHQISDPIPAHPDISQHREPLDIPMHTNPSVQMTQMSHPPFSYDTYQASSMTSLPEQVPDFPEAMDCLDKVIRFVDAQRDGFLSSNDHQALGRIKLSIIQLGTGDVSSLGLGGTQKL